MTLKLTLVTVIAIALAAFVGWNVTEEAKQNYSSPRIVATINTNEPQANHHQSNTEPPLIQKASAY